MRGRFGTDAGRQQMVDMTRRLILSAEVVGGAQAVALGLAHWVAPAAELETLTRSVAAPISDLPAAALAACRRCIDAALDDSKDGFEVELAETGLLRVERDAAAGEAVPG